MSTWSKNSIWGHFDDGCKSKSHYRVIILTKIINLGVWEQLSILKIALQGISQTGSRPHLIQHIKLCSCADFHAFITIFARSSFQRPWLLHYLGVCFS